jgi:hypothetical protein
MTQDTYGPASPLPFASYDPASSSWRMSQGTFPWDSPTCSLTLPGWGLMRAGALYELRTPGPLTSGRACSSSLLPTPRTSDVHGAGVRGAGGLDLRTAVAVLLPTPTAMDAHGSGGNHPSNVTLTDAVVRTQLGARSNPRFAAGKGSPDAPPLHLWSQDEPESD